MMKIFTSFICLNLIFSTQVLSQDSFILSGKPTPMSGNEYISGSDTEGPMMKIRLLGAVKQAGVHLVPLNTDLSTLFSYAGGINDNAKLDVVKVRRLEGRDYTVLSFNFDKHLRSDDDAIKLKPNDIVYLPVKQKAISDNFFKGTAIFGTIITSILTAILIKENL